MGVCVWGGGGVWGVCVGVCVWGGGGGRAVGGGGGEGLTMTEPGLL